MLREVKNFFGMSLKNGTIIVGIAQSIMAFTVLILSAVYAERPNELIQMADASILPDLSVLKALLIIIATASGVQCVLSIVIIFAAEAKRPLLLLPWLFFNPAALVVFLIAVITAIVHHSGENNIHFAFTLVTLALAVFSITGYNILVVHSYYKYLRRLHF